MFCFSLGCKEDRASDNSSTVVLPERDPQATSLPCSCTLMACKGSSQTFKNTIEINFNLNMCTCIVRVGVVCFKQRSQTFRDPPIDVVKNTPGRVGLQQLSVNGVVLNLNNTQQ